MSKVPKTRLSQMMSDLRAGILKLSATLKDNIRIYENLFDKLDEITDESRQDLLSKMKANDLSVRALGDTLEMETVKILSLQAPFSRDLRTALSSFRIIYDMQRIARDITHSFDGLTLYALENLDNLLGQKEVFKESIHATENMLDIFDKLYTIELGEHEYEFDFDNYVKKTEELDDIIDDLFEIHSKNIIKEANDGVVDPESAHQLLASIRSLERTGDHFCNIIERAIYIKTGDKIEIL